MVDETKRITCFAAILESRYNQLQQGLRYMIYEKKIAMSAQMSRDVSIRSRNCSTSPKGCVVNGQNDFKTSNK